MKFLSPKTKRHQAIEFLHSIGKHDETEQFEAMSPGVRRAQGSGTSRLSKI
jgi:hypothetical protein